MDHEQHEMDAVMVDHNAMKEAIANATRHEYSTFSVVSLKDGTYLIVKDSRSFGCDYDEVASTTNVYMAQDICQLLNIKEGLK